MLPHRPVDTPPMTPWQRPSRPGDTTNILTALSLGVSSLVSSAPPYRCSTAFIRGPALYVDGSVCRQALGTGKALTHSWALPMITSLYPDETSDLHKKGSITMSEAVYRATQTITPDDLSRMVLPQRDLPPALRDF